MGIESDGSDTTPEFLADNVKRSAEIGNGSEPIKPPKFVWTPSIHVDPISSISA